MVIQNSNRISNDPLPIAPFRATLTTEVASDGTVQMLHKATTRNALTSRLLVEIYDAQLAGTWSRLKPASRRTVAAPSTIAHAIAAVSGTTFVPAAML